MSIRPASRLALALVLVLAGPALASEADFTTDAYLDEPELFQIAILAGAMGVLREVPGLETEPGDADCFSRWSVHEDVLAIVAHHVGRHPIARGDPFGATLAAALRARCR